MTILRIRRLLVVRECKVVCRIPREEYQYLFKEYLVGTYADMLKTIVGERIEKESEPSEAPEHHLAFVLGNSEQAWPCLVTQPLNIRS